MKRCVCALAASLLVLPPAGVSGQDTEWNRYTLEDLGGVHVRIEAAEGCSAYGIAASDFEASTSLQLIEAEVGVLTREEMLEHHGLPELRVSLDCVGGGSGGPVAYAVSLRVQQAAQMLRDTQITLPEAVTWYSTAIGVAEASSVATDVTEALTKELGEFAEAWQAANAEGEGGR
jgi:hypothetical protein